MSRDILNWCRSKGIILIERHLLGSMNKQAEQLSRNVQDSSDWEMNQMGFQKLNRKRGPFTVDLFAKLWSAKVKFYYSMIPQPKAAGIDTLTHRGPKTGRYAFPQFVYTSGIDSNQNTAYKKNDCDNNCMDNAKVTLDELRKANNAPIQRRTAERSKRKNHQLENLYPVWVSRMNGIQRHYRNQGFSIKATIFMAGQHRPTTVEFYNCPWLRWTRWCDTTDCRF